MADEAYKDGTEEQKRDRSHGHDAVVNLLRIVARMRELGCLSPATSGLVELGQVVAREAPGLLTDLARSAVHAQTDFLRVNAEHFDRIAQSLFGDKTAGTPGCKISLVASAAPGAVARCRFRIKNPKKDTVRISFTTPVLEDADGHRLSGAVGFARVEPSHADDDFDLECNDTGFFEARVDIQENATGDTYEGTCHVVAANSVLGIISLRIEVSVPAPVQVNANTGAAESSSSTGWSIRNPHGVERTLSIGSPVVFLAGTNRMLASLRAADSSSQQVTSLGAGACMSPTLVVTAVQPASFEAGTYQATAGVLLGAQLAQQLTITLEVK